MSARSDRSGTASTTSVSAGRLSTRPIAPSSVCSAIRIPRGGSWGRSARGRRSRGSRAGSPWPPHCYRAGAACSASSPSAIDHQRRRRAAMGRRAAVVGALDGARARAPVHALRDRRRQRRLPCSTSRSRRSRASRRRAPEGPFDLGCLYIGTNDVRAFDWDPFAYERGLGRGAGLPRRTLRAHADSDAPARPRAPARGREGGSTPTRSSSAARARPARSSSTSPASAGAPC